MFDRTIGALLCMLLALSCQDKGPKDDVADIRETYAAYVNALRTGDGEKAASMVDGNTLAYYDRMLDLAREADSTEVARSDVMDKITILALRMHSGQELHDMDARDAIAAGASAGLMGGEEMASIDLGNISVDGDHATAPIVMSGFPLPAKFRFERDDAVWKIDITPLFTISRMAFEQMALRSGIPTNDWLMEMLTQSTGERPGNDIWHPKN